MSTEIPYVYENRSGGPVYLVNCAGSFDHHLERRTDEGWKRAWTPILKACLSAPIVVTAGATFQDTIRVYAAAFGSRAGPQFDVADPSGTYRIVWTGAVSSYDRNAWPFGPPLPLEQRVSNRFTLQVR